jgi:membrane protein implicated in regulation of membrane protease activity
MRFLSPGKMIALGFFMVILGFVLAAAMVIQVLEASFLLIFVTYAVSTGGLLLGFVGTAYIVVSGRARSRTRDYDHDQDYDHHQWD